MMVLTECSEDNSRKNNFVMNLPTAMIGTNVDEKLDQWMPSDKSRPSLVDKHVYDYSNRQDALKTPMCMVAELARHNKLKHEYVLMDESGLAHKKRFTVKLVLCPGQEFEGVGPSIKKAQQMAAQVALQSTTLPRLFSHARCNRNRPKGLTSPLILLKNVAEKIGVKYDLIEDTLVEYSQQMQLPHHILPQVSKRPLQQITSSPIFLNDNRNVVHPINLNSPPTKPPLLPIPNGNQIHPFHFNGTSGTNYWLENSQIQFAYQKWPMENQFAFPAQIFAAPPPPVMYGNFPPPPIAARISSPTFAMKNKQVTTDHRPVFRPIFPSADPLHPFKKYRVTVHFLTDGSKHVATEPNLHAARIKASTLALAHLNPQLEKIKEGLKNVNEIVIQNGAEKNCTESIPENKHDMDSISVEEISTNNTNKDALIVKKSEQKAGKRRRPKSAVSQLHEYALRLKLNIEFEVIVDPASKPHNRKYTLRCLLTTPKEKISDVLSHLKDLRIVSEGEGSSKKAAKQCACQKVLDRLREITDNDPIILCAFKLSTALPTNFVDNKSQEIRGSISMGKFKDVKRKTIVKDLKLDPKYGQNINPISRLLQVVQVHKQQTSEPLFRLINEYGQNRHKEFTVEVRCMGFTATGIGPSKKLAKRASAEQMLSKIGFTKPMPQPGKSLLKKQKSSEDYDALDDREEVEMITPDELGSPEQKLDELTEFEKCKDQQELASPIIECSRLVSFDGCEVQQKPNAISPDNSGNFSDQSENRTRSLDENDTSSNLVQRRVTFNSHVRTCPASDDESYPFPTLTPLKSDVVSSGKIKKRSRHSNVKLSASDLDELVGSVTFFCSTLKSPPGNLKSGFVVVNEIDEDAIFTLEDCDIKPMSQAQTDFQLSPSNAPPPAAFPLISMKPPALSMLMNQPPPSITAGKQHKVVQLTAKKFLEQLGHHFKFTVVYSDFPKAQDAATEEQCFSLVTIGLDKPIICHGSGATETEARNDAAFNALKKSLELINPRE